MDSILPKGGLIEITENHYRYSMTNVFISAEKLDALTLAFGSIEARKKMTLQSQRPVCNYGFNRPEREMLEVVTFNFLKVSHYYGEGVNILSAKVEEDQSGINFCYLDIFFTKNV